MSKKEVAKEIFDKMQKAAGTDSKLHILENEKIADAVTNGKDVYVTGGLIDKLDKDELAYVIGHEIAHNKMGHADEGQRYANSIKGHVGMWHPLHLLIAAGQFAYYQGVVRKENEIDSDLTAKSLMKKAGFDENKAASALVKLDPKLECKGKFLDSHPPTKDRIDILKKK